MVFLTKNNLWGLTKSLEETKDHRRGCQPPVNVKRQRKSRKDDRNINKLKLNVLHILSPFQGLVLLTMLFRGLHPRLYSLAPSVLFPRTAIVNNAIVTR